MECSRLNSSREKEEGPFRSLTRPMSSLVVRAAITSNVTAATAASGNKVVKWLRWLAAACVRCWQQKLLKRLFTQPDFLQNLRVTKILVLSTTTSSVFVGRGPPPFSSEKLSFVFEIVPLKTGLSDLLNL